MKTKDASPDFIRRIADYYICNYTTLDRVAKEFNLSNGRSVSELLYRGVAENILDEITSSKIYHKVVFAKFQGQYQRKVRWDEAMMLRHNPTRAKEYEENLKALEDQIAFEKEQESFLHFQITSFDDFFFDEAGAPSKEDLEGDLYRLQVHPTI